MLTKKKRLYAEARESGKSITDSAVWAGCPQKTAAQAGSRMEKDADVIACRARLKAGQPAEMPEPEPEIQQPAPVASEQKKKQREVAPNPETPATDDPIQFMRDLMKNPGEDPKLRLDAAKALASFTVAKPGEKGKKDQQKEKAEETANKFAVRRGLKAVK